MRRIKVCLLGLPPLLQDLALDVLGADPELELMIEARSTWKAASLQADVVVTPRAPKIVERLLYESPRMQAFVIERDARQVRHSRLQLVSDELGELSLPELAGAIKKSVPRRR